MPYVMFDSVNANDFPTGGFDATAGYTTGKYPSSAPIRARFPHLPHVTIAISARVDADCLDVEPGDATPDEAPGWFDRQPANRIIYCNASTVNQVRAAMGNRDYLLWSAHYNNKPHICGPGCGYPQADATQWWDHGPNGENVDQSLLSDKFWAAIAGGDDMPSSEEVARAVWGYPLARGGLGPAGAADWLADARLAAGADVAGAVWHYGIERGGLGPANAADWLADARLAAGEPPAGLIELVKGVSDRLERVEQLLIKLATPGDSTYERTDEPLV